MAMLVYQEGKASTNPIYIYSHIAIHRYSLAIYAVVVVFPIEPGLRGGHRAAGLRGGGGDPGEPGGPVGGKRVVQRKMGGCGVKTWGTSAKLMDF